MDSKNNTGKENSGNRNSGDWNSGDWNSGDCNSGDCNSGNRNRGNRNSGDWNRGDRNSGNRNRGDCNSGNRNRGNRNSGDWNNANKHVGCFNTIDATKAYYFNQLIDCSEWDNATKPDWIYQLSETTWVNESDMTDQEKIDHSDFHVCGGYLRQNDMKEEWQKAYADAAPEDIELTRQLPNFDAAVFEEITGIDLSAERQTAPKEIQIDGATYVLKQG